MKAESRGNLRNGRARRSRRAWDAPRGVVAARTEWLARSRPRGADAIQPWAEGAENYSAADRARRMSLLNCRVLFKYLRGRESATYSRIRSGAGYRRRRSTTPGQARSQIATV